MMQTPIRRMAVLVTTLSLLLVGAVPATTAPTGTVDVIVLIDGGGNDIAQAARETAAAHGVDLSFIYQHAVSGFAGSVPQGRLAALERDPRVSHLELDQEVRTTEVATGIDRTFATSNSNIPTGRDGDAVGDVDADIAIIDSGIAAHPALNVVSSVDCTQHSGGSPFTRTYECMADSIGNDGNGHGTHVAGTAAGRVHEGKVVGIAPGARLHAVKVLNDNGSGSMGGVIAGVDWVAGSSTIEVANMSLGGGFSTALNDAVNEAVTAGVVFAVAAGNDDKDAKDYSPASAANALTVSALADFDGKAGGNAEPTCRSDEDDTLANFSNWGAVVDIAAPGVCILSTWNDGGYYTISGTSMASPYVAGAAALLASNDLSRTEIEAALLTNGNTDWTDTSDDRSQEPLLDVSNTTVFAPTLIDPSADDSSGDDTSDPVGEDPSAGFTLEAAGYKAKGVHHADLSWTGDSGNVDVFRDDVEIVSDSDLSAYTDNIGNKGGGSYTYKVCETGTSTCSNTVTVTF